MRPASDATCSPDDPRVKCSGRWDAMLRGDFLYSFRAGGYVWSAFDGIEGGRLFTACPWCKHPLPDQGVIYRRLRAGILEDDG